MNLNDNKYTILVSRLSKGSGKVDKKDSLQGVFMEVVRLHFVRMTSLMESKGIHHGQQHVLTILKHKDGCSQKQIAEILRVKPATITVMIQRMEKNGLVIREQDKNDQRVWRIFITHKGREDCKIANEIRGKLFDESFNNFTDEEKMLFRRLLLQMRSNLSEKVLEGNEDNKQCFFRKKDKED